MGRSLSAYIASKESEVSISMGYPVNSSWPAKKQATKCLFRISLNSGSLLLQISLAKRQRG